MGCEAVVAGGDPPAVASVLAFWEGVFSPFRADSELSRVNASPAPVQAVSPFFGEVVSVALAVAAETDGLVDPR
jgi:thiamine biosynthesis lipoprotein ApbE